MNWDQIASSVILPAIVSGGISIWNNKRQKDLEINYNFRAYILDKRKKAYEVVEDAINGFLVMGFTPNKAINEFSTKRPDPINLDWLTNPTEFNTKPLLIIQEKIFVVFTYNIWITDDLLEAFFD